MNLPVIALWDSVNQRDAYTWLGTELANLRTAFRWAADHHDLDTAVAIAFAATFLGYWVQQYGTSRVGRGTHRTRASD